MDNKLDINVTEKKVSDENLLKTVEDRSYPPERKYTA